MSADGVFEDRIARTYDEDSADMFAPEVLGPPLTSSPSLPMVGGSWSSR